MTQSDWMLLAQHVALALIVVLTAFVRRRPQA
jgi:hypothetical protein